MTILPFQKSISNKSQIWICYTGTYSDSGKILDTTNNSHHLYYRANGETREVKMFTLMDQDGNTYQVATSPEERQKIIDGTHETLEYGMIVQQLIPVGDEIFCEGRFVVKGIPHEEQVYEVMRARLYKIPGREASVTVSTVSIVYPTIEPNGPLENQPGIR